MATTSIFGWCGNFVALILSIPRWLYCKFNGWSKIDQQDEEKNLVHAQVLQAEHSEAQIEHNCTDRIEVLVQKTSIEDYSHCGLPEHAPIVQDAFTAFLLSSDCDQQRMPNCEIPNLVTPFSVHPPNLDSMDSMQNPGACSVDSKAEGPLDGCGAFGSMILNDEPVTSTTAETRQTSGEGVSGSCLTFEPTPEPSGDLLRASTMGPAIFRTGLCAPPNTPPQQFSQLIPQINTEIPSHRPVPNSAREGGSQDKGGANLQYITPVLHRSNSAPSVVECGQEQESSGSECEPTMLEKCRLTCGVAEDIGQRRSMEDFHLMLTNSIKIGNVRLDAVVGVFDGHNGDTAAKFASENFVKFFVRVQESVPCALSITFDELEGQLLAKYRANVLGEAGTTALVAAIARKEIWVANLGDCRAVLSKNGIGQTLTHDQKPGQFEEKARIIAAGGFLDGEQYLNGEIGVARALGDFHLSDIKVPGGGGPLIHTPEVTSHEIGDDWEFLIIASDGLWDVLSNQRAVDLARSEFVNGQGVDEAAAKLVFEAKTQSSRDNITVAIITLQELPLPPRKRSRPKNPNSRLRLHSKSLLDLKGALDAADTETPQRLI